MNYCENCINECICNLCVCCNMNPCICSMKSTDFITNEQLHKNCINKEKLIKYCKNKFLELEEENLNKQSIENLGFTIWVDGYIHALEELKKIIENGEFDNE